MAVCKKCGSVIEEGEELCDNCRRLEEEAAAYEPDQYEDIKMDEDLNALFSLDDLDFFNDDDSFEELGDSTELLDLDGDILDIGNVSGEIEKDVSEDGDLKENIISTAQEYEPGADTDESGNLLEEPEQDSVLSAVINSEADGQGLPAENMDQEADHDQNMMNDDDIMSLLNMIGADEDQNTFDTQDMSEELDEDSNLQSADENTEESPEDMDDLFKLIGDMGFNEAGDHVSDTGEEPAAIEEGDDDIFSLDDFLMDDGGNTGHKEDVADVGDVFSDTLGVVNSLQDIEDTEHLEQLVKPGDKKEKNRKGLLTRLFGNVHDEKAKASQEKEEAREKEREQRKEARRKGKKEAAIEGEEEEAAGDEADPAGKGAKKAKKVKKEKPPKEKKVKLKEIEEETEPESEGRINRAGASIVFVLGAALALFIFFGTRTFTYGQSIEKASSYFGVRKYTKAYDEVKGLDIKPKDTEIYNKIVTVMYVNKQLNSYNNYFTLKMYPEALDSLLKGMDRYDKYMSEAVALGILTDLDYVRDQITAELKNTFGITEEEAYDILNTSSREEYGEKVVKAAVPY